MFFYETKIRIDLSLCSSGNMKLYAIPYKESDISNGLSFHRFVLFYHKFVIFSMQLKKKKVCRIFFRKPVGLSRQYS